MSDRPRGDPGWAWYEREVARLETALAEEREKNERLRGAIGTVRRVSANCSQKPRCYPCRGAIEEVTRAALASTGSEEPDEQGSQGCHCGRGTRKDGDRWRCLGCDGEPIECLCPQARWATGSKAK
jgi:hypothetical protein